MGEPDKGKDPVDFFPGERVAQGGATLDQPARQESLAQLKGDRSRSPTGVVAMRRPDGRAPTVGAFRRRQEQLPRADLWFDHETFRVRHGARMAKVA